ncbi:hypothetical protein MMC07_005328 [Pseudocyphellaria aurata]|nr:hypothetical protein [Pseudocyphellaria aurata]
MPSKSAKRRAPRTEKAQHSPAPPAPQPRTYQGRFGIMSSNKDGFSHEMELALRSLSVDFTAEYLQEDKSTTDKDKLERMKALYARWKHEDDEEMVGGADLQARQRLRAKEIGLIVFGFILREQHIEAIWTLYSERNGLLLLAKTEDS